MLEVGTKAPDFTLQNQEGKEVSLSDFKGKKVILYFYPKDLTSGCTKQACGFKERYPLITEKGAVVIGISKDSVKKHEEFGFFVKFWGAKVSMHSWRGHALNTVRVLFRCVC